MASESHINSRMVEWGNFFKSLALKMRLDFTDDDWEYTEEPHISRRRDILKKHPEIKTLMGAEPLIAYLVTIEVAIQIGVAYTVSTFKPGGLIWFLLTYVVSATLNHSLAAAIHEIGHNLAFGHKYGKCNRLLSLWCNLPMIVPVAISYKKYHHEHHRWLGHEELDVDIPMKFEVALFKTPLLRVVWILINPFFYTLRPFFKSPQGLNAWEILNIIVQLVFSCAIYQWLGASAFLYLFCGTLLGFGLHPMAAHVISEHYLFADNLATHSYYGPLNFFLYNVGYHVEHHDFPYIPFTRLHKLKIMAPEFYDHLPFHSSLCKVMWDFVFMPALGPGARSITASNLSKPELYSKMAKVALESSLTYPEKNSVNEKKM